MTKDILEQDASWAKTIRLVPRLGVLITTMEQLSRDGLMKCTWCPHWALDNTLVTLQTERARIRVQLAQGSIVRVGVEVAAPNRIDVTRAAGPWATDVDLHLSIWQTEVYALLKAQQAAQHEEAQRPIKAREEELKRARAVYEGPEA